MLESDERFCRLYNDTPAMLHSIDRDGRLVSVSNHWLEVLGYERGEVIGRKSTEFLTEASRRYAKEVVLPEYFKSASCKNVPYQFVTKSGKILDILLSATAERDGSGEIIRSLAVLTDITEGKRAEEALKESEEKFSWAFHATPTILVISTMEDGTYIEVNKAFERTLGYSREETIGRSSLELDIWENPEDRDRYVHLLRENGEVRDLEVRFRVKSGGTCVGLLSGESIELNGEKRLLSLVNDITARKRAEEALRESEERYRRIVETSQEGIWALDAQARTTYLNQRVAELLGYSCEEIMGSSLFDFVDGACRAEVAAKLESRKSGVRDKYETIMLRKDGGKIWVSISGAPLFDKNGAFMGSIAMISDVTSRKRAEEEIEILNTDLASHAYELEIANKELEAFSYTVSHDLRSPLTGIIGFCEVLQEMGDDKLDEQYKRFVRNIHDAGQRMDQLISTLLNFSRLTRSELNRQTVDLSEMASSIFFELKMKEPLRDIKPVIAQGITVNGDLKLLRIVLENLIGNAWKYTGKKAGAVVEFGATEVDGKPAYFVRDNGAGFHMAQAERLFAPFQRLTGTAGFEGHGIGLATVQRIIQRHGGRVWGEGEPGKGAAFYFSL